MNDQAVHAAAAAAVAGAAFELHQQQELQQQQQRARDVYASMRQAVLQQMTVERQGVGLAPPSDAEVDARTRHALSLLGSMGRGLS